MKPRVFLRGSATAPQRRAISQAALAALADQQVSSGQLAIAISGRQRMQDLNREFANVDHPTDVLSFPDGSADPQTGRTYLGDVVICLPIAREQAAAASHSVETELALLTIHGVLHLLGHDHAQPANRQRMWQAQSRILGELGIVDRSIA